MFGLVPAECKICKKEVEQELDYHGPEQSGFSYSCGCSSAHTKDKDVWTDKDGNVTIIKP